jgi:uncharacterized protein (DUF2147 family)
MQKRINFIFFTALSMLIVASAYASERFGAMAVTGVWRNEENAVHVMIERVGSKYHGRIIWLERPNWPDGTIKLDRYNPDPSMRSRPFIGMRTVIDMEYIGDDTWGGGRLYDPESGKTYGCRITLESGDIAVIRGYIGLAFIGKSVKFYRVS